jgi:DNA-binding response OmpR family regulator
MKKKNKVSKEVSKEAKKKVMVVDDEPDIRDTVKLILEKEGYEVVTAISGDDCLTKLYENPDLILMDIMMPGTPTKDVVKKIKGIKIAYLSVVRVSEAEREKLMKSKDIVDFIQKPFDVKTLVKRVKKILGK